MSTISRTIESGKVVIKAFGTNELLFEKPFDNKPTAENVVETINEFSDKVWDKKTPWMHSTEEEFAIYECSEKEFLKIAKPLEGEKLEKRIAQIKKQREARNKK